MKSKTAANIKIKRNKFFWGFVRNLKVSASNKQLWLIKVYRYLSLKKIYFFNPFFVMCNPICGNARVKLSINTQAKQEKRS